MGETILSAGRAIADASLTGVTFLAGSASLVEVVALWALGFGSAVRATEPHVEETNDPVRASRHAANALTLMVVGLITVAVANEQIIGHPHKPAPITVSPFLFGGPICSLLAQGWYVFAVPQVSLRPRLLGVVGLCIVGIASSFATPLIAQLMAASRYLR